MMQYNQNFLSVNPQSLRVTESDFADKKPVLFTLVGLPGSGKSTFAERLSKHIKDTGGCVEIISSDSIRKELYGSEDNQEHNNEVFAVVHSRIKQFLLEGVSVIFDATNISKKRRIAFLHDIKPIPCRCVCHAIMTPYATCLERNNNRERKVPEYALRRMYMNWEPPHCNEGFDYVHFDMTCSGIEDRSEYTLMNLIGKMDGFILLDQENDHHRHTLGVHCFMAMMNILYRDRLNTRLQVAALLHDIGKEFTKSRLNHKGVYDGNYHYYQHHCVSAYDSLFYLDGLAFSNEDKAHISNVIFYHMHPHRNWKQSTNAMRRDRIAIGEDLFNDVIALHDADVAAQ